MPKGDTLKATVGKAKGGIKKFESMSSTVEKTEEKLKGNKKKQEKGKDGEKISWKKQNIWIWHPKFNISKAIPILSIIGIVCIIIGAIMIGINIPVKEVKVDFTDCKLKDTDSSCHDILNIPIGTTNRSYDVYIDPASNYVNKLELNPRLNELNSATTCICEEPIPAKDIGENGLRGEVFLYYFLSNLHQNHRQYVKSRDNKQLQGDMAKIPDALSDIKCTSHFDFADEESQIPYFPCGAIANSLFNDTITLQYRKNGGTERNVWKDVPVMRTGIAHPTDIKYMFKNPPLENITEIRSSLKSDSLRDLKVEWPKDWGTQQKKIWEVKVEGDDTNVGEKSNVGFQNEDFIIWMRPATNPNFRKLYAKIGADDEDARGNGKWSKEERDKFKDGLPGEYEYQFKIEYNYNSKSFGGKKKAILSTASILGGKNYSGGITYFLSGVISLILSVVFLGLNKKGFSHKLESTA